MRQSDLAHCSSRRKIAAPSHIALSLPKATARGRYFMPQSDATISRSGGKCFKPSPRQPDRREVPWSAQPKEPLARIENAEPAPEPNPAMVQAIARAHSWVKSLSDGTYSFYRGTCRIEAAPSQSGAQSHSHRLSRNRYHRGNPDRKPSEVANARRLARDFAARLGWSATRPEF
jgi:hypothetical protein